MRVFQVLRVGMVLALCVQLLFAPVAVATSELVPAIEGTVGLTDQTDISNSEGVAKDEMNTREAAKTLVQANTATVAEKSEARGKPASPTEESSPKNTPAPVNASSLPINYEGVIITQIQTTGGDGRSYEDLIEIRNNSSQIVDVTNWTIRYTSSGGAVNPSVVARFTPLESELGWKVVLPPGATYLLGNKAIVGANPGLALDQEFTLAVATSGGRLMIYDAAGEFVSGYGWGPSTLPVEGAPFDPVFNVMQRKMADEIWHQNTRDNLIDFEKSALRQAYEIGQMREVYDSCLNLQDIQPTVPGGYYRDELTGNCSENPPPALNKCEGLILSEIGANLTSQFIEIHNPTNEDVELKGCRLLTNRNSRHFEFEKHQLKPGGYWSVSVVDSGLTLSKTTGGSVYLVSEDGDYEVGKVSYPALRDDASWAIVNDEWLQTYSLTPGEVNVHTEFLPCEEGYNRNPDTGRCNRDVVSADLAECAPGQYRNPLTNRCKRLETAVAALVPCGPDEYRNPETNRCRKLTSTTSSLVPCGPGQYRSPETNRCRNIATTASTLKPCGPDEFRNPETNRCKKIASTASTLKPCQPGYERNPETNRCRKAQVSTLSAVDFPVEPVAETARGFAAWWALGGVLALGAGYGVWEWRSEIGRWMRRMTSDMTIFKK